MQAMRTLRLVLGLIVLAIFGQPLAHGQEIEPVTAARITESDGSTTLVHEVLVPASRAEVWHAVSTAEGWMNWAVPIAWSDTAGPGTLETSYNSADKPGSPGTICQQIVATIPGRMFAFRTTKAPQGFPEAETYYGVTSIFELSAENDGTRVRLTAVNYPATPSGEQLANFFIKGNATALEELRRAFLPD